MKSAAVLGASSMLGTELVRQLRANQVNVISIGRGGQNDIVHDLAMMSDTSQTDLPEVDALFHCASAFADDSAAGQWTNCQTNTLGCLGVLGLMRRLRCSTCIYAGSISSTPGADEFGRSSYGLSKALGEQILTWGLSEHRRDSTFCSVRLPQLFDTEGRCCLHQQWFGRIVAYASRGLDLNMPPPGGARNFLHVDDAARLMILAQHAGLTGTWNACHPESLTYLQIAQHAYDIFDSRGRITTDASKAPFRSISFPDGTPLLSHLRAPPLINIRNGLKMIQEAGTSQAFGPLDVS